jgi:hypothetical protein
MPGPSTTQVGAQDANPERETVIKFVISGPFLNAEAAHTQWSADPPSNAVMDDLMRRIADLERKLDEERAVVESLSRLLSEPPAAAPAPVAPPVDAPPPTKPVALHVVEAPPQDAAMTVAAPAPPPLSTVVRTPPPKVRGLRRMIGALRHL